MKNDITNKDKFLKLLQAINNFDDEVSVATDIFDFLTNDEKNQLFQQLEVLIQNISSVVGWLNAENKLTFIEEQDRFLVSKDQNSLIIKITTPKKVNACGVLIILTSLRIIKT